MTFYKKHNFSLTEKSNVSLVLLLLIVATIIIYYPIQNHDFVNYDDNLYVTENDRVKNGLSLDNAVWAFRTTTAYNWHPITWLSHMLDVELFGMNAGGHHMTSLLFHIVNSLLLFLIFKSMTAKIWQSGIIALLFAIHPLHVESVAWVAERKDVISTFFGMLAIYSYVHYTARPGVSRYLLVVGFFIAGLMAKPMLVTLPFVLLLLDYWPLRRIQSNPPTDNHQSLKLRSRVLQIVWEKTPLFILSLASSIVTLLVQKGGGAVGSTEIYPLTTRVSNSLVAYIKYIVKMFWPANLAVFYPHPYSIPIWQVIGAGMILGFITFIAIRSSKRHPWFIVGWLWFLGTLVPVIGLVQVGSQAMADRYAYIPLIGLFIIVVWAIPDLFTRWQYKNVMISILSLISVSALMVTSWLQVRHWENSISLFGRALTVTENNYLAHNNYGVALAEQNRFTEAIEHYKEVIRTNPTFVNAYNNLGNALTSMGHYKAGIKNFSKAIQIDPDFADGYHNWGIALLRVGQIGEAISKFRKALKIRPDHAVSEENLQKALAIMREINNDIENLEKTLESDTTNAKLYINLGALYGLKGNWKKAIDHYREALSIQPYSPQALNFLAIAYAREGRYDKALNIFKKLVKLKPDLADTYYNIASLYAIQNNSIESLNWLKQSIDKGYQNWDLIKSDPDLENIRDTSEFKELIKDH